MPWARKRRPTIGQVNDLVNAIKQHLQGNGPELQGAALADLLAMYIAGHHPALREEVLNLHIEMVRALVAPNEAAIFAHFGKPEGWEAN